mmetsp:Transcript_40083/g.84161  ORF Transcript_40083/g.84161 Transcript_40083/m.84161 type:complete len:270 (-) Transcript_40083:63-872(-)|eukprot:CAMPEP_0183706306 /NCGR_PEP_ID=MMETSP0737-20130205/3186_1 /TAXON_ID=385413 /ORGANISM="Thalassiosira miniscula, Strain CCMP1093" /LENGTH=269 /DNA_ID=CAMNT_0025933693 /DNA_START=143 /DNA_END=952 /DNA_ORIENTATION=+
MVSNATIGNVGLVVLLFATSAVTYCMLNQLPSPEYFDENWLNNGFCVSNASSKWGNSHSLSFYADSFLALCIGYLFRVQPKVPTLQSEILSGAILGVFGHGVGHLHLGMDAKGMDLRFRAGDDLPLSAFNALMGVFAFGAIFKGTLPLASIRRLGAAASIATAGFTIFNIPPELNFVYAQAVIYIFVSLHMLTLGQKDKSAAIFALYPYAQLPVLFIGMLESTVCATFLRRFGGHMIYDISIAIGVICIELIACRVELARAQKAKTKCS